MSRSEEELLRLLRVAYDHGQADALAYADEHSTRSAGWMTGEEADACFETWLRLHKSELNRLLERLI